MPQQSHIYIEVGSGGGDGSQGNPYRANTAIGFDQIMRGIAANSHIHIGAGEFLTLGQRHRNKTQNAAGGIDPVNGDLGWDVRSNWTISGAGEGVTVIKLERWPDIQISDDFRKFIVVGCHYTPSLISNVIIGYLTVDGQWDTLPDRPDPDIDPNPLNDPLVALHCVFCYINGSITCRNVTVTGFYGKFDARHPRPTPDIDLSQECFALACSGHPSRLDPLDFNSTALAVFGHCTVHHGSGDYCGAIASFNNGPSIINGCHVYSIANTHSGVIGAWGKDIRITNNVVTDCFYPLYFDTGNVINLLVEGNQFISSGQAPIFTNSTSRNVYINVRKNDDPVNQGGSFDGVYVDVPIRPPGVTDPMYRIRLYFHRMTPTESTYEPPAPDVGILVPIPYAANASIEQLEGMLTNPPYDGAINAALNAYFDPPGAPSRPRFVGYSRSFEAATLSPVGGGEWIYHSKGASFSSDESKVYIQSGWSWTNWVIRNNYLEVAFKPKGTYGQQYLMHLEGNGSTDRDYRISDNVCRFTGGFDGIQTNGLWMVGIKNVTVLNNAFHNVTGQYGGTLLAKVENTNTAPAPVSTLHKHGNRALTARPIYDLGDDLDSGGTQQAPGSGKGIPLTGTVRFEDEAHRLSGIVTGSGTDFQGELRPGDLLATDTAGKLGSEPGPF